MLIQLPNKSWIDAEIVGEIRPARKDHHPLSQLMLNKHNGEYIRHEIYPEYGITEAEIEAKNREVVEMISAAQEKVRSRATPSLVRLPDGTFVNPAVIGTIGVRTNPVVIRVHAEDHGTTTFSVHVDRLDNESIYYRIHPSRESAFAERDAIARLVMGGKTEQGE